MHPGIRALALLIGAACATAAAAKPTHVDVMTCTRFDGTTVVDNVYAYTIGGFTTQFMSVYLAGNKYPAWMNEYFAGTEFRQCTLAGYQTLGFANAQVTDVTASGVGAAVDAGTGEDDNAQKYTHVIFYYTGFIYGSTTPVPAAKPLSAAEKTRALADFKASGLARPGR